MAAPKKGVAYDFPIGLVDSLATSKFKVSPTIVAGDFKISKDYGSFADLDTLPAVLPAGGVSVKVIVSLDEMTSDKIVITGIDLLGDEWNDTFIFIDNTIVTIDDLVRSTTPANSLDILNGRVDIGKVAGIDASGMGRAIDSIGIGTVDSGATIGIVTTSVVIPTVVRVNQFKGRVLSFTKTTATVELRGQSTIILGNTLGGTFSITDLTDAPQSGDEFTIQ